MCFLIEMYLNYEHVSFVEGGCGEVPEVLHFEELC